MTDQHRATPEQWRSVAMQGHSNIYACLLELRARIEALEAFDHHPLLAAVRAQSKTVAHLGNRVERLEDLHAALRSPAVAAAEAGVRHAMEQLRSQPGSAPEPAAKPPASRFTAKYLFTSCDIVQDSFCYDPDDSSVWFETAISNLVIPGDNIKIAHHWGETPDNKCYSTINYKVLSTSETEIKSLRVRAIRVDASDSAPATANPLKFDVHADFSGPQLQFTLVERVAASIAAKPFLSSPTSVRQARAAIREVAEWLRENPGPNSAWLAVARDLMDEANR